MVGNPVLSGAWPQSGDTSVILRPEIQLVFQSPSLIDPRTWGSNTFALYGPGDVVYETGPGTILNSGIQTNPYSLLDGVVIRERIPGTYSLYTSGYPIASGIVSSRLGVSGTIIYAVFTPDVPLNSYTEYSIVLIGDDGSDWIADTNRIMPGITSWTSSATFSGVPTSSSGIISVITSYSKITQTNLYSSTTGYNDTFNITITSGSNFGTPAFTWSKRSAQLLGSYPAVGSGIHNLTDGLTILLSGVFNAGESYGLNVYIPKPLLTTASWKFVTGDINSNVLPITVIPPSLIIDRTPEGAYTPAATSGIQPIVPIRSDPENLAYGVSNDQSYVILEFNNPVASIDTSKIHINISPIAGMPNVSGINRTYTASSYEIYGNFVKLYF